MQFAPAEVATTRPPRGWLVLGVWLAGWLLIGLLDAQLDLANKALILVLVSVLAALWATPGASIAACALSVLAFNYAFVPPRGTLSVDLHQHALLLVTTLVSSWIVSLLMARQRRWVAEARRHAQQADELRSLGDRLREIDDPQSLLRQMRQTLEGATGVSVAVMLLAEPHMEGEAVGRVEGLVTPDEHEGLRICALRNVAMGPGTGRHEEQPAWYLPLRGRQRSLGSALVRIGQDTMYPDRARHHLQSLCDQMGLALEQVSALRSAALARDAAQAQTVRSTLLAAIAHDHRTPLATILSAASSLHDQADRLDAAQRRRLAATIADEAGQLERLTENTLQLARLDGPGPALHLDWESVEEIVGAVMRRLRQRDPASRVRARVAADLPLLRCDAVLLVQLLDNLVDNALKYGGDAEPVEIVARQIGDQMVIAVRDRGPGVPLEARERIFEVFWRGEPRTSSTLPASRGAGVGLAVGRAIARAHGGELRLRMRAHGGAAFELWMTIPERPAAVHEEPEPRP